MVQKCPVFRWIYTKKKIYRLYCTKSITSEVSPSWLTLQQAGVMRVLICVVPPSSGWEFHLCLTIPSSVMIQLFVPLCCNFRVVSWWAYSAISPLECKRMLWISWPVLGSSVLLLLMGHPSYGSMWEWVFSRGVMQSLSGSRLGDSVPRVTLWVGAGQDCAVGRETKGALSSPFVLFRPVYLLE